MLKYAKLRELTHSHISVQLKPIACVDQCLLGKIKDIGNINAFHGILTHLHCRQDIELVITSDYYSTHYQLINHITFHFFNHHHCPYLEEVSDCG